MIKFIDTAFMSGRTFSAGMIAEFDPVIESALIAEGDAVEYSTVELPVEVLSSYAYPIACISTGTDEILASFTIPGGILGPNSIIQITPLWTFPSTANEKKLKVKVGGITIYSATRTTSTKEGPLVVLANRNSLTSQIVPYDSGYFTAGSTTPLTANIDMTDSVTVEFIAQRANGSESVKLEYYCALHFRGV
jgi:hypothetical protein